MSEFDFGSLLKEEEPSKKEEPTEPTPVVPKPTPKPTQKIEHPSTRTSRRTDLEPRLEAVETHLLLQQVAPQLDPEGGVLGLLLKELKATKIQGPLKFKPRDFRNVQRLPGPGFKVVWDWLLKEQIIIPEHALTEEQIARLGVTKTTGGRYVCDYHRLP